jgi:hypothetical protein
MWCYFARNDAAMDVDLERGFGMDDGAPMLGHECGSEWLTSQLRVSPEPWGVKI